MPFKHLQPSLGGAIRVTLWAYTRIPPTSPRDSSEGRTHSIWQPAGNGNKAPGDPLDRLRRSPDSTSILYIKNYKTCSRQEA